MKKQTAAHALKPAPANVVKSTKPTVAQKLNKTKLSPMQEVAAILASAPPIIAKAGAATRKDARDAERAKRFPTAAKQEAGKKAAAKTPKEAKPVKVSVPFVAKKLVKGAMAHIIAVGPRPTKGVALYAHTFAALHLLGMFKSECPAVSENSLLTVIGQRAVVYHTKENNMIRVPGDKIALTPAGYAHFGKRGVDGKMANAFMDLFVTGNIDPVLAGITKGSVYSVGL